MGQIMTYYSLGQVLGLIFKKGLIFMDDNRSIVLGSDPETGNIVVYEASSADFDLASIVAVLAPILISAGLKALMEFIANGEFALAYPGGKLKFLYKLFKDKSDKPNVSKHVLNVILNNETDTVLN